MFYSRLAKPSHSHCNLYFNNLKRGRKTLTNKTCSVLVSSRTVVEDVFLRSSSVEVFIVVETIFHQQLSQWSVVNEDKVKISMLSLAKLTRDHQSTDN